MQKKIFDVDQNPSATPQFSRNGSPEIGVLERNINPYELLLLVKRVGSAGGFSTRMVHLLEYYIAFTREIDWQDGQCPIVYQTLSKTAMDLGISERQVQRLEKALAEVGALSWQDSGNFRRYGQRCAETGEILYACGVNLAPLAHIEARLRSQLAKKCASNRAWHQTKCEISKTRRKIKLVAEELDRSGAKEILGDAKHLLVQIRTHMGLDALLSLLKKHEKTLSMLHAELKLAVPKFIERVKNIKMSFRNAIDVAYFKYTNSSKFLKRNTSKAPLACFQGVHEGTRLKQSKTAEQVEPLGNHVEILDTGVRHISIQQAISAASERFLSAMPISAKPVDWSNIVEAAYRLCPELGISQRYWGMACASMGRTGAAICVLLTDFAAHRIENRVKHPAGYFHAMVNRAQTGELHLHKSVFGIIGHTG